MVVRGVLRLRVGRASVSRVRWGMRRRPQAAERVRLALAQRRAAVR